MSVTSQPPVSDFSARAGVGEPLEERPDGLWRRYRLRRLYATGEKGGVSNSTTKAPSDSDFGAWGTSSDVMSVTSQPPVSDFSARAGVGEPLEERPDGLWRRYRLRGLYATEGRQRPSHGDDLCHATARRYQHGRQELDRAFGAVAPLADFATSCDKYFDHNVDQGGGELSLPSYCDPADSALFSEQE